jgi:hypothetical protein
MSLAVRLSFLALPLLGAVLWSWHAGAWGLGGRSPVLGYDAAQYALAARELADHGRLATTFALPLELSRHAAPPWPLAVVQPGLVLAEAALFRLAPRPVPAGAESREWLVLLLPLVSYLVIGLLLALVTWRLLSRHAPATGDPARLAAALTIALAFYLDPEAQHFACGGFTELPFTLGLLIALALLALGRAPRHALPFGLLLGVTGALRGNMLWLAPAFAVAVAILAPRGRRARAFALVLLGYALPLAPWWIYKWRAFGSAAWDLSRFAVWDGVRGHTWFSLHHVPELPALPTGFTAAGLLAAKTARNLPRLLLDLAIGPRALWLGALVAWLALTGPPRGATADDGTRAPRAAAGVVLAVLGLGLLVAAVGVPVLRYLFPARIALEAAGLLALWALLARLAATSGRTGVARFATVAVGVLALGWGGLQTARGLVEARATSAMRGMPGTPELRRIAETLDREAPGEEPVMSNLGPLLAWYGRRPVLHLATSPADLDACRRRLEFRHVLLVFRDESAAWPEWREVVAHPREAPHRPEWNVRQVRLWRTDDGFTLVWLELGPPPMRLAARARPAPDPAAPPA